MRERSEPGPQDRLREPTVPLPLKTNGSAKVTQAPAHPGTLLANLGAAPPPRQHSLWIRLWTTWGVTGVLLGQIRAVALWVSLRAMVVARA
jgi:hypothetical protein